VAERGKRPRDGARAAKIRVRGRCGIPCNMIDVIFGLDGGDLPEGRRIGTPALISDLVFGLLELLGIILPARPPGRPARPEGLADQARTPTTAPLSTFARGRMDLAKIRRETGRTSSGSSPRSTTGTVRAYDVVAMLQRDGHPTRASARRSPPTGGSSSRCTSSATSTWTSPTGATSRASGTCRKDGMPLGAEDLPRPGKGASCTTGMSGGPGEPARRARPGPELRRAVDDRLTWTPPSAS